MTLKTKKLTIIMATLDAEKFLEKSLRSVASNHIDQIEVLVIDGGSTDSTLSIANDFEYVRTISSPGSNLPKSWNLGLREATGEFVSFLDSDDLLTPCSLDKRLKAVVNEPLEKQIVIGKVQHFLDSASHMTKRSHLNLPVIAHMPGTLLCRRQIINKVGNFDETLPVTCDIEWFARARDIFGEIKKLDDVVLLKRLHQNNLSKKSLDGLIYERELLRLLKVRIERT